MVGWPTPGEGEGYLTHSADRMRIPSSWVPFSPIFSNAGYHQEKITFLKLAIKDVISLFHDVLCFGESLHRLVQVGCHFQLNFSGQEKTEFLECTTP